MKKKPKKQKQATKKGFFWSAFFKVNKDHFCSHKKLLDHLIGWKLSNQIVCPYNFLICWQNTNSVEILSWKLKMKCNQT